MLATSSASSDTSSRSPDAQRAYRYAELDSIGQDRAREQAGEALSEWQQSSLTETFRRDLNDWGLQNLEVEWSLGYCQGDGVALYGKVDATEIIHDDFKVILLNMARHGVELPHRGMTVKVPLPISEIEIELGRTSFSNHYSHYNSFTVECTAIYPDGDDDEDGVLPEEHPIAKAIEAFFRNLCQTMERYGYDSFEDVDANTVFFMTERFSDDGTNICTDDDVDNIEFYEESE